MNNEDLNFYRGLVSKTNVPDFGYKHYFSPKHNEKDFDSRLLNLLDLLKNCPNNPELLQRYKIIVQKYIEKQLFFGRVKPVKKIYSTIVKTLVEPNTESFKTKQNFINVLINPFLQILSFYGYALKISVNFALILCTAYITYVNVNKNGIGFPMDDIYKQSYVDFMNLIEFDQNKFYDQKSLKDAYKKNIFLFHPDRFKGPKEIAKKNTAILNNGLDYFIKNTAFNSDHLPANYNLSFAVPQQLTFDVSGLLFVWNSFTSTLNNLINNKTLDLSVKGISTTWNFRTQLFYQFVFSIVSYFCSTIVNYLGPKIIPQFVLDFFKIDVPKSQPIKRLTQQVIKHLIFVILTFKEFMIKSNLIILVLFDPLISISNNTIYFAIYNLLNTILTYFGFDSIHNFLLKFVSKSSSLIINSFITMLNFLYNKSFRNFVPILEKDNNENQPTISNEDIKIEMKNVQVDFSSNEQNYSKKELEELEKEINIQCIPIILEKENLVEEKWKILIRSRMLIKKKIK